METRGFILDERQLDDEPIQAVEKWVGRFDLPTHDLRCYLPTLASFHSSPVVFLAGMARKRVGWGGNWVCKSHLPTHL